MNFTPAIRSLGHIGHRGIQIVKVKVPTILMASGIVSGIAGAVVAVKRTPIVYMTRKAYREDIAKADSLLEAGLVEIEGADEPIQYTQEIHDQDVAALTVQKYKRYIKAYLPAIGLGLLSVTCILTSHHILMLRNAALTATVATLSEAFKRYRKNVREEYGDQVDYNMRHSIISEKVKTKEIDPETGKEKTVTKNIPVRKDLPWRSDYARCFEDGCRNFVRNADTNRCTLMTYEAFCNHRLQSRGYLFLNEVYELLGFEETLAGSELGWVYAKDGDNEHGDNYVDFGFHNDLNFMEGNEYSVWLDFNVDDTPIKDRIKWRVS